jgi:hypothetical protein
MIMQLVSVFMLISLSLSTFGQTIFEITEKDNEKFAFIENSFVTVAPLGKYRVVNDTGEVVGTVEIVKITDKYLLGKIIEGEAQVKNFILTAAVPPMPDSEFFVKEKIKPMPLKTLVTPSFGFTLGYSTSSMSFIAASSPASYSEPIILAGGSLNYSLFYQKNWRKNFTLRFSVGGEGFGGSYAAQSATINSDGSATSTFSAAANSFGAAILWRWYEDDEDTFHYWLGLGYTLHYVSSYSTNLFSLRLAQPMLNSFEAGLGFEYPLRGNFFLPVSFWYASYYNGPGLAQSGMSIGGGLGYRY